MAWKWKIDGTVVCFITFLSRFSLLFKLLIGWHWGIPFCDPVMCQIWQCQGHDKGNSIIKVRSLSCICTCYRNMPIKGASPNKGAPLVWRNPMLSQMTKIDTVSLIIVRFSIRNHRWKAGNLNFLYNLSDLTLLERPAPLLGRIR